MGNKARVAENSTVVSTSTCNFPNRPGNGADVFLASAELASILGKIPRMEEYMQYAEEINTMSEDVYCYLNFNEMENYTAAAENAFPVMVARFSVFNSVIPAKPGMTELKRGMTLVLG